MPSILQKAVCFSGLLIIAFNISLAQGIVDEEQFFQIDRIIINGNKSVDADILRNAIISKETPSKFSQFVFNNISEKLGSKPEYFNEENIPEDLHVIENYYRANGYFHTVVVSSYEKDTANHTAVLRFEITENHHSYIDSIQYVGLETLPISLKEKITSDAVIKKGMPYSSNKASAEIARILNLLANNGYPAARFDQSNSYEYEYMSSQNFMLQIAFIPGKYYIFGSTTTHVEPARPDIYDRLSLRHLDFLPGETFSREKIHSSERSLNRLGIFETARVDHGAISDSSNQTAIPIDLYLKPRVRNELSPEFIISDEDGFFNLGIGLGYTNRNFLGDARIFDAGVRLKTQDIQRWDFKNVFNKKGLKDISVRGKVEIQLQITQPYLITRTLSANWTSTISAEKQPAYILSILRNKIGLNKQFAAFTYGYFDWTLERVSPDILQDTLNTQVLISTLREEDKPQFNSIFTITLQRDKTNDLFSPTDGFFHSLTLEESGLLPKYLPGIRSGLPFTQYYKISMLGRWYQDLTWRRFNIFAWKLHSGYQNKYGESKYSNVQIPLNRRFFAGGSGSVRGWNARELGAMPAELIQLGGNFILDASAEMRVSHFQGHGNIWFIKLENIRGVYFVDIGNVWSDISRFRFKDLAAAAGFGIRYETFFGPFRIDYGFRLYDPNEKPGQQTIFNRKFFGETLNRGVFHFGIGHAF
ncbi:MAG: BamA/TamA family outer membrane protein [Ignavibacteriales bacterium]|nr:BamA/TamA family outer membrane protein [Ignavibacteriales bacterium]